jgi:hypothetical protein
MMTVFGPTVKALTKTFPFVIPPTSHPSPLSLSPSTIHTLRPTSDEKVLKLELED